MFTFSKLELFLIYIGLKCVTLRPLRKNNKGYFKKGSVQQIKLNLFDVFAMKIKILDVAFIDLKDVTNNDCLNWFGISKNDYMKFKYNQTDETKRVKYTFEIVEINYERLNELNINNWMC